MRAEFSQGLCNQSDFVLDLCLERLWGSGTRCVSGVKCQYPLLARPTLSANGSWRSHLLESWIGENTTLSFNSDLQRKPHTHLFWSGQGKGHFVGKLCRNGFTSLFTTVGSSCQLGLSFGTSAEREITGDIQLHCCGRFSTLEASILLWGLSGEREAGGQLGSEQAEHCLQHYWGKPPTWDKLLTKSLPVKTVFLPSPWPFSF